MIRLATRQDLFALVDASADGGIVLDAQEIAPAFFDLRTGLAGELLQCCENYGLRLAVVVAEPSVHGERFVELVREHRTHARVRFLPTRALAEAWISAASA